jgi:hypothetical protein
LRNSRRLARRKARYWAIAEVISMRVAARHSADFRNAAIASRVTGLLAGRRVALARQVKRQAPSFEWKQVSK